MADAIAGAVLTPEKIKELEDKARAEYAAEQLVYANVRKELIAQGQASQNAQLQAFGQVNVRDLLPIYNRDKAKTHLEMVELEIASIEQNRLSFHYPDVKGRLATLKELKAKLTASPA